MANHRCYQLFLGGSCAEGTSVKIVKGDPVPPVPCIKGTPLRGGPQMIQVHMCNVIFVIFS